MPELAEVEYFRKRWDPGLGQKILRVDLRPEKRIFRGADPAAMRRALTGVLLLSSEANGKQMLFRFSHGLWLGLHLGMTGRLVAEQASFVPGKHDHLIMAQRRQVLVFSDARQFGRVRFHRGASPPPWWSALPAALTSPGFTPERMGTFLNRHPKLPLKAALLLQEGFPGIGNWMADEILWRAGIRPAQKAGRLTEAGRQKLWKEIRFVCREALETIGKDFSDPPPGWLFHARWGRGGRCPKHQETLERKTIGGRTTAWCARCQTA